MEQRLKKNRGKTRFIFYLLVVYILAALVWLFILLEIQNRELHKARIEHLNTAITDASSPAYQIRRAKIEADYERSHVKYAGKGSFFWV